MGMVLKTCRYATVARRALVRVRATQPGAGIELDRERLLALVRLVVRTV